MLVQIIGSASETAAIAGTVRDTQGVVFVPALTVLGAPHWDPQARGSIHGITRGSPRKARDAAYRQWLKAVERSKGWEQPAKP